MSDDLKARLKAVDWYWRDGGERPRFVADPAPHEAADLIDQQAARIAALEEAALIDGEHLAKMNRRIAALEEGLRKIEQNEDQFNIAWAAEVARALLGGYNAE